VSAKVHLSPSEDRDKLKELIKKVYFGDENRENRQRARAAYVNIIKSTN